MKKRVIATLGVAMLVYFTAGFACSFTTADLSDIKFSKNKDGAPATAFNTGEEVYAITEATGIPSGKHKVTWKVTDAKGTELGKRDMDIESSAKLWTNFTPAAPSDYKVEATLTDDAGKTIATKTATVKVTGSAAPVSAPADDKKKDEDDDDN